MFKITTTKSSSRRVILARKSPFSYPSEAVSPLRRGIRQAISCTPAPILCKFSAIFCQIFASTPPSVSTPNFQKSTPNFQKALTFFSLPPPFFRQNEHKYLKYNHLANPLKIRFFPAKKFLAQNFQNLEGFKCSFSEQALTNIQKQPW